jgi:hypothetical protein
MTEEIEEEEEMVAFIPLWGMLEMVAFKRGLRGIGAEVWVQVVFSNLGDVGVHTLREFMVSVLTVNKKLADSGHCCLEAKMLTMMMAEGGEMMCGPEDEVNLGERGRDGHQE